MRKAKFIAALHFCAGGSAAFALEPIQVGPLEVTPYARIVAGVDYTRNVLDSGVQGSRFQLASNQWGTSYWGVRASTALTDGWRAVAHLESGFGSNDGQSNDNGTLFNRASNVGLAHERYGALTMGHQWIGLSSLVGGRNWGIGPRTLQYRSPLLAGFQLGYMHMAGGAVGSSRRGSGDGVSLSFTRGGLRLSAIVDQMADDFGRYTGGPLNGLGSQGEWKFSKQVILGGSYDFGATKVFAGYNRIKAPDANFGLNAAYDTEAVQTWLGLNYRLTQQLTLLGAVYHLKQDASGKKSTLFSAGLNYEWSRHFTLYATIGMVDNSRISDAKASANGANNRALYYWNTSCGSDGNCNGARSIGGYGGFALKF